MKNAVVSDGHIWTAEAQNWVGYSILLGKNYTIDELHYLEVIQMSGKTNVPGWFELFQ